MFSYRSCVSMVILFILGLLVENSYSNCARVFERGVSQRDANIIVRKHNYLRVAVANGRVPGQPAAKYMKFIRWSPVLAKKAQEVANSCKFEHVSITGTPWTWVGQNLYIHLSTGFSKGANWDEAIQSWFNEHNVYKFGAPFAAATGHYTQLVWADTDHVGCGYTSYLTNHAYKYQKLYVCNYGPGGNYVGRSPYIPK